MASLFATPGITRNHAMEPLQQMVVRHKLGRRGSTNVPGWTTTSFVERTTRKGNTNLKKLVLRAI